MSEPGTYAAGPMRPWGRQTRTTSSATARWSGANMAPKADTTTSKVSSSNGMRCGSATLGAQRDAVGLRHPARCVEEMVDEIDGDHLGPTARRRERRGARAGDDVEHPFSGVEVDRFAEQLGVDAPESEPTRAASPVLHVADLCGATGR